VTPSISALYGNSEASSFLGLRLTTEHSRHLVSEHVISMFRPAFQSPAGTRRPWKMGSDVALSSKDRPKMVFESGTELGALAWSLRILSGIADYKA